MTTGVDETALRASQPAPYIPMAKNAFLKMTPEGNCSLSTAMYFGGLGTT